MQPQYVIKDHLGRLVGPFNIAQDAVDWARDHRAEAGVYVLCPPESVI